MWFKNIVILFNDVIFDFMFIQIKVFQTSTTLSEWNFFTTFSVNFIYNVTLLIFFIPILYNIILCKLRSYNYLYIIV